MKLRVEWRRFPGDPPLECGAGASLSDFVRALSAEFAPKGVQVEFAETVLDDAQENQRNMILFNGVAIEKIVLDPWNESLACGSCSDRTEEDGFIRSFERNGRMVKAVEPALIRQAAQKALELFESP